MTTGDFLMAILAIAFTAFILAWFTILPTLGLFYIFGWLA